MSTERGALLYHPPVELISSPIPLFACCSCSLCLQSLFCPCVLFSQTQHRMGEDRCCCCVAYLILCLPFHIPVAFFHADRRQTMMKQVRIKNYNGWCGEDWCSNLLCAFFCGCFALAQEKLLLDERDKNNLK